MGKHTQPPPAPSEHPDVCDLVVVDLVERKAEGVAKYGTPLRGFNGRDALHDAYEEALDQVQYLRQRIYEAEHGQETCTLCGGTGAVLGGPDAQPMLCPSCGVTSQQAARQALRDQLPDCPRCAGVGTLDYPGVPGNCYYCGGTGKDASGAPPNVQQMVHALRNRTGTDLVAAWAALRDANYSPSRAEQLLHERMGRQA